jgi:hypothetical protein
VRGEVAGLLTAITAAHPQRQPGRAGHLY